MAEEKEEKKGGGMKIVMIVLVVLIVAGGSTFAGLYFGGFFEATEEGAGEEEAQEEVAQAKAPAIYVALDPPFVVNFSDPDAKSRFLQINGSILTRDPVVETEITTHITAIRSKLSILFSTQKEAALKTVEGQEQLATDAVQVVRKIISDETGKAEEDTGVEEFLITGMVMQ